MSKKANLRLPTLKQLENLTGQDGYEWLASLERILNEALAATPEEQRSDRQRLERRLQKLKTRRAEYEALRSPKK